MIRGKKNYLPPSSLVMGFSVMYKLDESSIANHINDRKIRIIDDDSVSESTENDTEIMLDDIDELETGEDELNEGTNSVDKNGHENVNVDHVDVQDDRHVDDLELSVKENLKLEVDEDDVKEEDEVSSPEEEFAFPDTNIELKHVEGESFQLKRGISTSSQTKANYGEDFVYLGDDVKVSMRRQDPGVRKPRLSAKQKRDLKKKNKVGENKDDLDVETEQAIDENDSSDKEEGKCTETEKTDNNKQVNKKQAQVPPLKRGQKKKQKKMKDKYKDQDEEDKEIMQQLYRSHEPEKLSKKQTKQKQLKKATAGPKLNAVKAKPNVSNVVILYNPDGEPITEEAKPTEEDEDLDDLNEEEKENITVLDSLTGCPREDDVLLYAIPICAPYSTLQNFKFKVKLTPGTGRRGKAAKTALHIFQNAKETTDWEKDLFKCLKDVDISRNIPGKVKVSAPNFQKAKKK